MSYSIFYKSMFIKSKRGLIPMMQIGDNNVWECDNKRRAREWTNINLDHGRKFFTHDEILSCLNKWNESYQTSLARDLASDEEYKRAGGSFGFYEAMAVSGKHTTKTSFNDVKNLVMSGEKIAVTIETAIKSLGLYFYFYEIKDGEEYSSSDRIYPKTEEEFWNIIEDKFGGDETKFWIQYDNRLADDFYDYNKALVGLLPNSRGRKPKCRTTKNYVVRVTMMDGNAECYIQIENNQISLTSDIEKACIFNQTRSGKKLAGDIFLYFLRGKISGLRFEERPKC